MPSAPFATYQDIFRASGDRPMVFWGSYKFAEKTYKVLGKRLVFIVDNSPNEHGTEQLGVKVRPPGTLLGIKSEKPFVIITTTSVTDVSEQLETLGFAAGIDFMVSPVLNDLRTVAELESCAGTVLFASGAPSQGDPQTGGGIYKLEFDRHGHRYEKVLPPSSHGMLKFGDNVISVNDETGIFEFDLDFNIIRSTPVPQGVRPHGITYSTATGCFYVVCTSQDNILVYDDTFKLAGKIKVSEKFDHYGVEQHHCNDICSVGESLYVSMFSYTGNHQRDVFDGAVVEINARSGKIGAPVIEGMWLPHSITLIDGGLVVLDSFRGHVLKNNAEVIGEFPGMVRGIDSDGIHLYIGQSRNRGPTKVLGLSKNISLDSGIIIFDEYTKISRTLHLPPKIYEIHSVLVI